MQLAGAVAIVTGASRGIGRATALALARRGVTVVAVARDESALADVSAATDGSHFVADVTDPAHAEDLVRHTLETYGKIDIVVANAGVGFAGDFMTMPAGRIHELLDVNVRAPVLLAHAAVPAMVERRRGSVVFVTSIAGAMLVPRETVYSMTKAAVEAFAEPLREELRGTGVAVSTVLPGVVATEFFDRRGEPYERRFPRPVSAERVAETVVRVITRQQERAVTPAWLGAAARFRSLAPGAYRALARRFG